MKGARDFDIVIIGGGLVGASLACALKDQPLKIALIEKKSNHFVDEQQASHLQIPQAPKSSCELTRLSNARALALSPPSVTCLKMLSVWEKVQTDAEPIQEVHVSKKNHFGVTKIKASTYQLPALGYVVNADRLNHALTETVASLPNVTQFCPDEIIEFKSFGNMAENLSGNMMENKATFQLASHSVLSAKLAVAADGGDSFLRKQEGIAQKIVNHEQTAIVCNLALKEKHGGVAYERFTNEGSIALLPLKRETVKCVWIVPNEKLSEIERLSDADFLNALQSVFGFRLGSFATVGPRQHYPLISRYAELLYSDRLVLIGNAANTLHPIAAQGFNLGLRDAATLTEHLVLAKKQGQEIGNIEFLRNYANARYADHQRMRQFTERLASPTVLQGLGILAAEWFAPLKKHIALRGLGKLATLPKLCRGVPLDMNLATPLLGEPT